MDSSEFLRFLGDRSSVREYHNESLSGQQIGYILSCARTAPSAGNREAWDVVIVTDKEIRWALAQAAYDQSHVEEAPALLVVCANYVRSMSRYGERGILYAVQDATIACTYMMLSAQAEGLSSCWTGAFDEDEVRGILGLPQHVRPVAILTVGVAKGTPVRTDRIPVAEHLHQEHW